ncbi:MAG TPA: ABC transporter ATP-binding protein, partial [Acidimicrobiales bacterium]
MVDADVATNPRSALTAEVVPGDGPRPGVVLSARDVTKSYTLGLWPRRRALRVLRGADVELRAGEIVGLVGENGSGKSTLMKVLVGSLPRDGGMVVRQGSLGYCPQEPVLYERLTCDEHFELFGMAYGMARADVERSREGLYEVLGFGRWAGARVEELSGGTRAKLNLGLALLPDPQILLLDEPYAGFDWDTYQRFWEITRARRAAGRSLLIISHFITDEDRFDRVYDLRDGR